MSFARGERVYFDFDSGAISSAEGANRNEETSQNEEAPAPASTSMPVAMVSDILERAPSAINPPAAPAFKTNATGFPVHKKRANRVSAFKQQRTGKKEASITPQDGAAPMKHSTTLHGSDIDQTERQRIDEENRRHLAAMSEGEIEQERNELLSALSPSLIQRLLARSNIDEGSNEQDWNKTETPPASLSTDGPKEEASNQQKLPTTNKKKVTFENPSEEPSIQDKEQTPLDPTQPPSETTEQPPDVLPPSNIHFPQPHQPPDLDPDSPSFLTDLHKKYFPTLPYDPSSLSWMAPIDPADTTSPYHPTQTALNASELRFNFKGGLLAPSAAREIPVAEGLHHHADAPEAAGYTIPELARLARSAVAAQRCIAYQTLGRVLYRLGKGEFGVEKDTKRNVEAPVQVAQNPNEDEEDDVADDEDAGNAMATGLWNCIEEGKVIETLTEEAARERGHLTARTFAQEALWNWRRGGGRKRKAV